MTKEELDLVTREDFLFTKAMLKGDEEDLFFLIDEISKRRNYIQAVLDYYGSEQNIPSYEDRNESYSK